MSSRVARCELYLGIKKTALFMSHFAGFIALPLRSSEFWPGWLRYFLYRCRLTTFPFNSIGVAPMKRLKG